MPLLLEDMPYRLCFDVERAGEVLPLQQCVDAKFETNHDVPWGNWVRKPESLLGRWEPTTVSNHLEEKWEYLYGKGELADVDRVVVDIGKGPIRRFVLTVLCPYHLGFLVTRSEAEACAWQDQLYYSMRKPMNTDFGGSWTIW